MLSCDQSDKNSNTLPKITNSKNTIPVNEKQNVIKSVKILPDRCATILDIDPQFYSVLNVGEKKSNNSIKQYAAEFNACSFLKLKSGYINDELLNSRENLRRENKKFITICEHHDKFVENFEKFLAENYYSSMFILKKSERKCARLQKYNESCNNLEKELTRWKSKIHSLKEKFRCIKIYRRFLHLISPLHWINEHQSDDAIENVLESIVNISSRDLSASASLLNILPPLKMKLDNCETSQLYFTEPNQIKKLFTVIEMQNLTSWNNAEKLSKNCENFTTQGKSITDTINIEILEIEKFITNLMSTIVWEEARAEELKKKTIRIAENILKRNLNSKEVVEISISTGDVYNKLIHKNINFDVIHLIEIIENEYEENLMKLDRINLETVKLVQNECYREDKHSMKTAQTASQQLKKLDNLCKHLKKSLSSY